MTELRHLLALIAVALLVLPALARSQGGGAGERPYEMRGRRPAHPPLVEFEDLAAWTAVGLNGAEASFDRSQEQRIWGGSVGKLTYRGAQHDSAVEIRPPAPIEIPGSWDCCYMWIYGDNWGWVAAPNRPRVFVLVQDAQGKRHDIELPRVDYQYWHLTHRRVVRLGAYSHLSPDLALPARFVGFRVEEIERDEPSAIYFDNLTFYAETLEPLEFKERAALPFPTTPDTILPTCHERCQCTAAKQGRGFVFQSKGDSATIRYVYEPDRGTLDDLHVLVHGGPAFVPLAAAGPSFEIGDVTMSPQDPDVRRTLREVKFQRGRLRAVWRWEKDGRFADWSLTMRLKGRSLILDIRAPGGKATRLDLGRAEGLTRPRAISVPYLSNNGRGPKVLASRGIFVSALVDWYLTDASVYEGPKQNEPSQRHFAGRVRYEPKTDGKRNPMRERIFVTVSPHFDEVLPNIPNPRSDMIHVAGRCLWRQMGTMGLDALKQYKAYGIDDLIPVHHEVIWRDGGESFTQRLESAPENVGDERLKDYLAQVRGLGYWPGLYTNYRDFAPVSKQWDPDKVNRFPDGNWQRAWPRNYVFKPMRAAEAEAYFAPRIHRKFGTRASYCDVHTSPPPWSSTDYDARLPGAGKFRTVFEEYGRLLLNESRAHRGPAFSEGGAHYMWAGLVDGNYGQMRTAGPSAEHPWLVDFDLLNIHPLETDFGMGDPGMYFGSLPWREERGVHSPYFDRFMAATIAFGHIGYLAAEWGLEGAIKSYYLIHDLQRHCAGVRPDVIRYNSPRGLVPTGRAITSGAYLDSQVYARYPTGLEVWVNGSWEKDWTVTLDGERRALPPAGFMARKPGALWVYSGLRDGRRVDWVESADYVYLDTRGEQMRQGPVEGKGAVAVRRVEGGIEVVPATRCSGLAIYEADDTSPARFLRAWHARVAEIVGIAASGEELGAVKWSLDEGALRITPLKGIIKYRIRLRPA